MPLRALELFSGLEGWSDAWRRRGREVVTVDIESRFKPTLTADVFDLEARQLLRDFGRFHVVYASPPCNCFTIMVLGRLWTIKEARYVPLSPEAARSVQLVRKTLRLIRGLAPAYWWLENPTAGLRWVDFMQRRPRVTVTLCQYGTVNQKRTDLWGRWPFTWRPRPPCRSLSPCHVAAPRGSHTPGSVQDWTRTPEDRALIPPALSLETCVAAERLLLV